MINRLLILTSCALIPALASGQTVLIDLGSDTYLTTGQPDTWNNAAPSTLSGFTGTLIADLLDTTGASTGISLNITDDFNGANTNGTTSGATSYPISATRDTFYTANSSWSSSPGNGMGVIEFTGLDPAKTYDFTMFASRTGTSENRQTEYAFVGLNSETVYLNPSSNASTTVTASAISPTAGGVITLTVQEGPANANQYDFAYLGVLEITTVPEPGATALIAGLMVAGLLLIRRRKA